MFENLLNLVKENAGDAIVNNPAIPNEHNDAAIKVAATGIMGQLKNLVSNGGIENLADFFKGNPANHPAVSEINNNVAGELAGKFGISADQASGIVKNLIPSVMTKLVSKTNDPNDNSFNIQDVFGALSGGSNSVSNIAESIKDKISGIFGK